jgi:hypothetical protein
MGIGCIMEGTQKDNPCDGPLQPCSRCRKPVCKKHSALSKTVCMAPKVSARRR